MPAHEEQSTTGSKQNVAKENNENSTGFSSDLIEEQIKANLEPSCPDFFSDADDGHIDSKQLG